MTTPPNLRKAECCKIKVGMKNKNIYFKIDSKFKKEVKKYKWHALEHNNDYFRIFRQKLKEDPKHYPKIIYLHRQIMDIVGIKNIEVDHINGDPSDNRIANLRLCNRMQNQFNMRKHHRVKKKYKGVFKRKNRNDFYSKIGYKNKGIYLGSFKSEKEAAKAYNRAAKKYHRKFARLNEVKND